MHESDQPTNEQPDPDPIDQVIAMAKAVIEKAEKEREQLATQIPEDVPRFGYGHG